MKKRQMKAPGEVVVQHRRDGTVRIEGPSLARIANVVFGTDVSPIEFPRLSSVRHARNVTRTLIGSLEQTSDQALEATREAEVRLVDFLQRHKSFKTKQALEEWAGDEVPALDYNGDPNPQYHAVWARVQTLIDLYAEHRDLFYRTRRIGRGTVYEFLTRSEINQLGLGVDPTGKRKRRIRG